MLQTVSSKFLKGDRTIKVFFIFYILCTYQSFAPPSPKRANEGPDHGIRPYSRMSGHVGISSNVQAHMENHPYVAFQAISN